MVLSATFKVTVMLVSFYLLNVICQVFRLRQLKDKLDIVISHDWPRGAAQYGNVDRLLKDKPFFA